MGDTDVQRWFDTKLGQSLLFVALAGAGVSGVKISVSDLNDRYHARTAAKDFALRDQRISGNSREIERLAAQVQRIDETHPPPELTSAIEDIRQRVRALELNEARRE